MDGGGYARISDYGLEVVLRGGVSSKSTPTNVRWTAPEVLGTDGGRVPSGDAGKAVDVYSFGMVMFEVRLPHFCSHTRACISAFRP